jgi:two-component system CheB/CheR fusion protein
MTSTAALCPDSAMPAEKKRVLVVDDNTDSARVTGLLLGATGFEVRLAYSGPEALEVAAEFAPAAVLLDIGLPGMDGYEVARELRAARGTGLLLVALSGYGQDEDRRRSAAAGFDHHLLKPADPARMIELMNGAG